MEAGTCLIDFETGRYNTAVCNTGYNLELATCSCVKDGNTDGTSSGEEVSTNDKESDNVGSIDSRLFVTIVVLAGLLLVLGVAVYLMRGFKGDAAITNDTLAKIERLSSPHAMQSYRSGSSIANFAYSPGLIGGNGQHDTLPENSI